MSKKILWLSAATLIIVSLIVGIWIGPKLIPPADINTSYVERIVQPVQLGRPDYTPPVHTVEAISMNTLFTEAAASVRGSVVFIDVLSSVQQTNTDEANDGFSWRTPQQSRSAGSGVLISSDGYIITNNHVVENAQKIRVLLKDKREYDVVLVGNDPTTDLAILKINGGRNLPVSPLADSDHLKIGEWVLAIGNPFRLTSTVTAGIVSAVGRQVNIIPGDLSIEYFIQTDAAINPGNSGGALVNLRGELVGINTAIATEGGSYEGYGFAIPTNLMTQVAQDIIQYGEVRRGYLGVQIEAITAMHATELSLPEIAGVLLTTVVSDGAADKAGLMEGDILIQVAGQKVNSPNELQSRIAMQHPGDAVLVSYIRDGVEKNTKVKLLGRSDLSFQNWFSEREAPPRPPVLPPDDGTNLYLESSTWGIVLRDLVALDSSYFQATDGAYVLSVRHGSPASIAGLPTDAIITQIDTMDVFSAQDAWDIMEDQAELGETSLLIRVLLEDNRVAFYDLSF